MPLRLASTEDWQIRKALASLRISLEAEMIRHSWLASEPLLPASVYTGALHRTIAQGIGDCWGDVTRARHVLDASTFGFLERLLWDAPCRDLDWTMRAFALTQEPA